MALIEFWWNADNSDNTDWNWNWNLCFLVYSFESIEMYHKNIQFRP